MAVPRFVTSSGVRDELAAHAERLLKIAEGIGDRKATVSFRRLLEDLAEGRAITGLHGWECGVPPNSGPWTLTADDQLVLEESPYV